MNNSTACINHISKLSLICSELPSIEKNLYQSAVENNNPIFNGEVIATSNGIPIKFNFKKQAEKLVSLGYLEDGKINLFASEIGNLYAKTEGKRSIVVGALDSILNHLNYNRELVNVLSAQAPDLFVRDLSIGLTEEILADRRYAGFVKMDFSALNGIITGVVKPCLRKYNIVVYQCVELHKDEYSFIVVDKKNDLNLYFANIIELEGSKIGKSYKLTSTVINTKPMDMLFIQTL